MDNVLPIFVINGLITWIIELVKKTPWFPWITAETEAVNRWLSVAISALAFAGIIVSFQNAGPGDYSVHVVGVTLANILNFLYYAFGNFFAQKALFKIFYSVPSPPKGSIGAAK